MQRLTESQRKYLWEATTRYRESLNGSPAAAYLESRGLFENRVRAFGLGYVEDPLPGHEYYRGCLAIPYMRWSPWRNWTVASIRFRRLDGGTPKYMTVAGDKPRLYNTAALARYSKDMAITEGEIDAITAELCGIPSVGAPGSQMWKPHFRELFLGYRTVNILADGDDAGMEFAKSVAKTLPNARIIPMPDGEDVNSLVMTQGKDALLERI
ncbi:DNA primase [Mycobacterium phage SuperCallie99]|uniref:DNA primase n=5 Tax=Caudoviricetes TaxID=2731619 RepID=A0A7G9A1C3_9CAUD|nr:DNA primase [Mycobacterium phage VohminGhazi]YP_009637863.1 DNA primase [Mycobacterium phage EricB]AEK08502.1 DNA primase [Mycobacterium phage DaVinci]AMQ66894.1 DNA primase [Mycobacterium phage McFly]AMW64409.1 DNA primase [Mycobacterium phage Kazan]AOT24797.1 DNA primase [Mycobacterium phage Isiphiwo]AVR76919.1 DNA primase [Mycobacterium phage GreedyLawyer]QBP28960.1 DNA primase [Mycobacterium phage Jordennis]QDF15841.1 DNA primase [Mycobacterium phage Kipper29]QIN93781.1 DNA primase 